MRDQLAAKGILIAEQDAGNTLLDVTDTHLHEPSEHSSGNNEGEGSHREHKSSSATSTSKSSKSTPKAVREARGRRKSVEIRIPIPD